MTTQSFANPIKHNYGDTVQSAHITFGYYPLQCYHNITTNMTDQKLRMSGKQYISFKADGRISLFENCAKSRELTKVFETIIYIG